jgi:arylsulfatase A-like enzyme
MGVAMALKLGDHAAILKRNEWEKAIQAYLANISFVDDQIGRLLNALESGPNRNNTIVVLFGDHGWHLGEKSHWRKFALWEEATRTPLIFAAPGMTSPGSQCTKPVDFMSIYPTLTALAGLPKPAHVEGDSLVPLLQNPAAPWSSPAFSTHGRGNHAVRSGPWRYIRYSDGTEELYNHDSDPNEWTNLALNPSTAVTRSALRSLLPAYEAPPK